MKRFICLFLFIAIVGVFSPLSAQWVKTFSGSSHDYPYDIKVTADGGLIVVGLTNSFGAGAGSYDIWVIKLDANGERQWDRTIGGLQDEWVRSILQTDDGGYIIAGSTWSYGSGESDFMIVKLFPDGSTDWIRTYGGTLRDEISSINQVPNGNFIVAGDSSSFTVNPHAWFLLISSEGIPIWQKTYLGNIGGYGTSAIPTRDGGYILAGSSHQGTVDSWLVKVNYQGERIWEKTYGMGHIKDVMQLETGDLVAATADRTIFKLTSEGDVLPGWGYAYSNTLAPISQINSIEKTRDGGFIIIGHTNYLTPADNKIFALKLSSLFQLQWQKVFDFRLHDEGIAIAEEEDGGYFVAAASLASSGPADFLVIKMASNGELGGTCGDTVVSDYQLSAISVTSSESSVDSLSTEISPNLLTNVPNTETFIDGVLLCQGEIAEPYISSLTPASGMTGIPVIIAGMNFGEVPGRVLFNGLSTAVTSWSEDRIECETSALTTTGPVIACTSDLRQSNGVLFTVIPFSLTPTITELRPDLGMIGDNITIIGSNFGSDPGIVKFNGVVASTTAWNTTEINAAVPAGATSGPVVVYTSVGASNEYWFTVTEGFVMPVRGIAYQSCPDPDLNPLSMVWTGRYGGDYNYRCEGTGGHPGVDITPILINDEILSIGRGVVEVKHDPRIMDTAYGKYVIIRHDHVYFDDIKDGTIYSIYCHLKSISEEIAVGQTVERGQTIGIMGKTSTIKNMKKHLHFQVDLYNYNFPYPYWPKYTPEPGAEPVRYPSTQKCKDENNRWEWCDIILLTEEQRQEAAENVEKNTVNALKLIERGGYK